jgi:mannose-6-phosphate isomerase
MGSEGSRGLGELIAEDPRRYLGAQTAEQWGELPFLFKLLAAEHPLSIQAHPNRRQAAEGFARETRAGIPPDAAERNYKDPNHKPEIICALAPFTGMCGFRPPDTIRRLLSAFLAPAPAALRNAFSPLMQALEDRDETRALRDFFIALFALAPGAREALTAHIRNQSAGGPDAEQVELMRLFAERCPHDPALVSPLYLNLFHLAPAQALFLPAGVPHAYLHGFGLELMANSDNVLRGGLTSKHVDIDELVNILDFHPHTPRCISLPEPSPARFRYPAQAEEFSLQRICGGGSESFASAFAESFASANAAAFAESGPVIGIVTEGELLLGGRNRSITVSRGESVFIPPGAPLTLRGAYTLFTASLPS